MLNALIQYAENILCHGRDRYRANPTPLFADGINVFTNEHLTWKVPGQQVSVVSDLACQQNLLRFLVALSNVTGDEKFKEAAKATIQYHFDFLTDSSGLLQWGGHRFVDLVTLEVRGTGCGNMVHELKNALPFYDLMFEVNPVGAAQYIKAFWNAHVYDWEELYIGRHGQYGLKLNDVWSHERIQKEIFRESTGLSFLNAGNDLIYAAAMYFKYTQEDLALQWAKHLAFQYVAARHPETGLGAYQFTQPLKKMDTDDDNIILSIYGDRAKRQFGPEFGDIALEANVIFDGPAPYTETIYYVNSLLQWNIASQIGNSANSFKEWTRQAMLSFAKYAYDLETNEIKPMFSDGKDLTGTVFQRNGYYGEKGKVFKRKQANGKFLLSFARSFLHTSDLNLWIVIRGIAKGIGLGELGETPGANLHLNFETDCADPHALFALLDLYQITLDGDFLTLGKKVGRNIMQKNFNHGYFTKGINHIFASFDAIEPLALITLEAACKGDFNAVPIFLGGKGFIHGNYQFSDRVMERISDDYLYSLQKM